MTVAARRAAVPRVVARGLSPRRAGVRLPRRRSTVGSQARPEPNAELTSPLHELARQPPRDGDRRVWARLRRRGQRGHNKPGPRLWQHARLPVRQRTRQRRLIHRAVIPVQATPPGHVWTADVLHDRCRTGTPLQGVPVMEECPRDGLAIEVAR